MTRWITLLAGSLLLATPAFADGPAPGWPFAGTPFSMPMQTAAGPRLGVGVTEMTEALRLHFKAPADAGVLVSEVQPDSAAAAAGVEVGDVIIRFDGALVATGQDLRQAVFAAAGKPSVKLEVARKGSWKTLKATIPEVDPTQRERPAPEGWGGRTFEFPGGQGQVFQFDLGEVGALQQRLDTVEDELEALRAKVEALESE